MPPLVLATSWGPVRLLGGSRAGEATTVVLPQFRLAVDAGYPLRALVPAEQVVVTHGHVDHLQGLLAWASQRQLGGLRPGTVFAPAGITDDLATLLATVARLEGGSPYGVNIVPVRDGDVVPVRRGFELRFVRTSHWVETVGGGLWWRRTRLRSEYADMLPTELRNRRLRGEEISEEVTVPVVTVLGDTGPEVFAATSWLQRSEVIVVECTFLDARDRGRAERFHHMHLDDLAAIAPTLSCRHLVLTHLSRRHHLAEGEARIRAALAGRLACDLHFLNTEWL